MLAFQRPTKPEGFDASTLDARKEIDAIRSANLDPASGDFDESLWQKQKHHFESVQYGKCGYCEHDTAVSYHGDVEHYAPKAGIDRFKAPSSARKGPQPGKNLRTVRFRKRGYYWRAYDWDNYLFACAKCNTTHKRCLFPVEDNVDDHPDFPSPNIQVAPLLLNPYAIDLIPSDHLGFDENGCIFDRSIQGWETIRVCGLDRASLSLARQDTAQRAFKCLTRLLHATQMHDDAVLTSALDDLAGLGAESYPFAGMVRIMAEHETGQPWAHLMALRST